MYKCKKEDGRVSENFKILKVGDAKCAHNELANENTKMFIEGKGASLST